MKKLVFPLILFSSLLIIFLSCSNKPKRSRKPVINIMIEPVKNQYIYGEKVNLQIETRTKDGEIGKVLVYYKNQLIKENTVESFSVNDITLDELGNSNFKVVAVKTDQVENFRIKTIPVYSDVVPEQLTYQTINHFPHSKNFYTQGLEFFKGFIYEGTGEYGKSALYQVNPATGNPVKSVSLKDEYFGEGITILNDKIYQITYRNQKGFVYNLSDFAITDSFRYDSKEGWGLTNNGKELIMSNGSHNLYWLNTKDFSVEKTIQVANHKGLINNLNELEFINGKIYANIYTTELIIEIEPETGRVLSEINLNGIINLYKNTGDTIDYMNGIAWDAENDRMFITGKWWPRMFEIKVQKPKAN